MDQPLDRLDRRAHGVAHHGVREGQRQAGQEHLRDRQNQQQVGDEDLFSISCLNCDRLGAFQNLDVRAEWRHAMKTYRLSVYIEVLNALYFHSDFVPIVYIEDGKRVDSMFEHLPIRPFMGVRADF